MNYENEIRSLAGETLALTSLLGFLMSELARSGQQELVSKSFEMAENLVTGTAMRGGGSPAHTTKALRIIEDLRVAAFGK